MTLVQPRSTHMISCGRYVSMLAVAATLGECECEDACECSCVCEGEDEGEGDLRGVACDRDRESGFCASVVRLFWRFFCVFLSVLCVCVCVCVCVFFHEP